MGKGGVRSESLRGGWQVKSDKVTPSTPVCRPDWDENQTPGTEGQTLKLYEFHRPLNQESISRFSCTVPGAGLPGRQLACAQSSG